MNRKLLLKSSTTKKGTTAVAKSNPTFVLINSDNENYTHKIMAKISKIDSVSQVMQVEGMYDLVARIESDSVDKIKDIVGNKIRSIEGVRTCLSLFGVYPYHHARETTATTMMMAKEVKRTIGKKEVSASSRV